MSIDIQKEENYTKNKKNKIENFDEPLEQPGRIFLAEIHGSAQRLLKIRKISKYIRFCKCCLLPSETTGVVIPYSCLDNKKDFGLGIFLYFHYIRFCILITFISLCLSSIPTMVFSIRYSNDMKDFCRLHYIDPDSLNKTNNNKRSYINGTNFTNNSNIVDIYDDTSDDNMTNDSLRTSSRYCLKYLKMNKNDKIILI